MPGILIAFVARGNYARVEQIPWTVNAYIYAGLNRDSGIEGISIATVDEEPLLAARNNSALKAAEAFGDNGILFMLDADMIPNHDFFGAAVSHLRMYPHAVIGSPYCGARYGQGGGRQVQVLERKRVEVTDPVTGELLVRKSLQRVSRADANKRTGIKQVAAVGTGIIAISTALLRRVPQPWFDYEFTTPAKTVMSNGEDFFFCAQVEKVDGCSCWVAWDHWSQHCKEETIGRPEEGDI